jgi:hypothetical protein
MDWLFEADRDAERRFPWISIPGVASIQVWALTAEIHCLPLIRADLLLVQ